MSITINASKRDDKGKGASRRLRHNSKVPAIIYGGKQKPQSISLDMHQINHLLEDQTVYTSVLDMVIDNNNSAVIIKDLQRHPVKNYINHIDFQRVDLTQAITTRIPLNFMGSDDNAAIRIGAVSNQFVTTVEVSCLPSDLPHGIDVDISKLEIGEHLSLTDLIMPSGVEMTALLHGDIESHNQTIISITAARKAEEFSDDDLVGSEVPVEGEEATDKADDADDKAGKDDKDGKDSKDNTDADKK